eukprot:7441911-Heterocapsa_arctica.AAC.1
MGTNPNGTQDVPFYSQELEHWHAREAEPDCAPVGEDPLGPEAHTGEDTWDAIDQEDAETGLPQQ